MCTLGSKDSHFQSKANHFSKMIVICILKKKKKFISIASLLASLSKISLGHSWK